MKLIDKDALVAYIESLIDEIYAGRPFDALSSEKQTALWYVKSIMSSINFLEVKEANLEKEEYQISQSFKGEGLFDGSKVVLKAQKGEKV